MKDGSEPRIQLEMALLKATQPQADLSVQALITRIERLESGGGAPAAAAAPPVPEPPADPEPAPPEPERPAPPPPPAREASAPVSHGSGGGVATAVAVETATEPATALELSQVLALWPAVAQAVADENGMLGAALGAALPVALEGDRLTIAFPEDAAFVKKKAEQGRDLVQRVVRGLTGASFAIVYELRAGGEASAITLDESELIERLRAEFAAEEVFEDEDEEQ